MAASRSRELADLTTLERLLRSFLRRHSRPRMRHEPLILAHEHVLAERSLLQQAMTGDPAATQARRIANASSDSVGE